MTLREVFEQDLETILEDQELSAGWPIQVTNPAGFSETLSGFASDIAQLIDPDTGQAVSGRLAAVSLRISSLIAAGFTSLPEGIMDSAAKPWVIVFNDINGNEHAFKISQSNPDRTIGIVTCLLELYKR